MSKASNRISFIEIPFLLGYKLSAGRFDIEVRASVSVAILTNLKTFLISPVDGSIKNYRSITNSPYRSSYWNFVSAAQVNYLLGKRFAVFIKPAVKYGLSSIFKNDYPINKKVKSTSIAAGIRVQF
jgi:hypothetical protein